MVREVVTLLMPERGGSVRGLHCRRRRSQRGLAVGGRRPAHRTGSRSVEHSSSPRDRLAEWRDRVELVHADFRSLAELLDARGISIVDGAVADLGLSSMQFAGTDRGFSFQRDEPLDMRMDSTQGVTAAELIARSSERELADAIYAFGEERASRRIARRIVEAAASGANPHDGSARGHRPSGGDRGTGESTRRRARFRRCASG